MQRGKRGNEKLQKNLVWSRDLEKVFIFLMKKWYVIYDMWYVTELH